MKIGVLSDTHISSLNEGRLFASQLLAGHFSDISAILHAGDHVHPDFSTCFYPLPWYAVRGNMDQWQNGLPLKRVVHLAGVRIGIMHGWGGLKDVESHVLDSFADEMPDVLVFGHTHVPVCRMVKTTLLFNPGSPTQRRSAPAESVGILTISSDGVAGEIIYL